MSKFLITPRSYNRKLGPMMVTTSPRRTCPTACPMRKNADGEAAGACYAEHGFLGGFVWSKLDRLPVGGTFKAGQVRVRSLNDLLAAIRALPPGAVWRHNQAGDLSSDDGDTIDRNELCQIAAAIRGRRGFTYTHHNVLENAHNRAAVAEANAAGFTINLSADSLEEADALAALGMAPVTAVVPEDADGNAKSPAGRPVIVCPAAKIPGMTCLKCRICAKQRKAIIAFPAHGAGRHRIQNSPGGARVAA